ncbi:hypothetical protein [Ralstonia pseudosolanacearum]
MSWSYTLYEDDDGSYVMSVVVPARDAAWAVYEKKFRLRTYEKFFAKFFPSKAQNIANRFLKKERLSQSFGKIR